VADSPGNTSGGSRTGIAAGRQADSRFIRPDFSSTAGNLQNKEYCNVKSPALSLECQDACMGGEIYA
jgi:hypothetical protein